MSEHQSMAPGDEVPPDEAAAGNVPCEHCGGSGDHDGQACPVCGGTGEVTEAVGGG